MSSEKKGKVIEDALAQEAIPYLTSIVDTGYSSYLGIRRS